ncbi:MAG: 50S ribosomal protein L5 [Nanoarchaeota archaeon]|nr:50S ribosomal protein L5 [Nanoarchaeota archaeon]
MAKIEQKMAEENDGKAPLSGIPETKKVSENIMKKVRLEKVTLNCGAGTEPRRIEKAVKLLELISGGKAKTIVTNKRIPAFGVRPGLKLGCKITIRGKNKMNLLKRLLEAIGNKLAPRQINPGSFSFGIKEYIEIPGVAYQRDIGLLGLDVCVTLTRPGARIERKKINKGKIPLRNKITKEDTIKFMEDNFNTEFGDEK